MKLCRVLMIVVFLAGLVVPSSVFASPHSADDAVTITILHTNDFHGQVELSGSNPGGARLAQAIRDNYTVGSTLVVDAGDEMQGSLLSNLDKGEPVIDVFNQVYLTGAEGGGPVGYDAATFGNHEFDWGLDILQDRVDQANYPYISANIVASADCSNPGWDKPAFVYAPYVIKELSGVKIALIGVTSQETPTITLADNTAGLCFIDPAAAIEHYYADMQTDGADAIIVLSHLGYTDGGYGYGIDVYGDQTLADRLYDDGTPVNAIIGGHSHTNLSGVATVIDGVTTVVQAHYNGRRLGKMTLSIDTGTGDVGVTWTDVAITSAYTENAAVATVISTYTTDPDYLALINTPIGYARTDLLRNYNGDSMMADFVDDAIYNQLNNDTESTNDVDVFFNNSGGIRTDWCLNATEDAWSSASADCATGVWTADPLVLTYGNMFTILPFGNQTIVGTMTGADIMQVLNQAATLYKGTIQVSGLKYSFYDYVTGGVDWAWGAFDVSIYDKATDTWEPLDASKTYNVGTNEFLAPAGQDGFIGFKYMTNITYWGDMLNSVNAWVSANYGTAETAYKGPNGDGQLDGRITQNGNETSGDIVPVTLLHNNDSHGRLLPSGSYAGLTQLATLINAERAYNPDRTLVFNLGDQVQGDSMMYYFKDAGGGYSSDGTALDPSLSINPMIAAMNAIGYDAMILGNHEFNFGKQVFFDIFKDATFPIMGANLTDSGSYGIVKTSADGIQTESISKIQVHDTLTFTLPGSAENPAAIHIGVFGLTNHRVPNYELPSNIEGLTFENPITVAEGLVPDMAVTSDAVVGLTHIGFTANPTSVEIDENVDTNLAASVDGIDAILGGHSHTDPSKQTSASGDFQFLPAIVSGPSGESVIINQAYRYNTYLGKVVLGFRYTDGAWELVSKAGNYTKVATSGTPTAEDATVKAIVDPYAALLATYNTTIIGQTTTPIDALNAFTEETSGGNLQADAAVYELAQHDITSDIHISGAMTNAAIASTATEIAPVDLTIANMFTLMPYENSLVVLKLNGPQIKSILERGYRNYYFYKYEEDNDYGGYSHYTTCMLDTDSRGQITYNDTYPVAPNGNNVVSFTISGVPVDFTDEATYYNVSTVNYLAAGSCNFNDDGVSLWPLDSASIVADTQYYVRDAVIDYVIANTPVGPVVDPENLRLVFNELFFHSWFPSSYR